MSTIGFLFFIFLQACTYSFKIILPLACTYLNIKIKKNNVVLVMYENKSYWQFFFSTQGCNDLKTYTLKNLGDLFFNVYSIRYIYRLIYSFNSKSVIIYRFLFNTALKYHSTWLFKNLFIFLQLKGYNWKAICNCVRLVTEKRLPYP